MMGSTFPIMTLVALEEHLLLIKPQSSQPIRWKSTLMIIALVNLKSPLKILRLIQCAQIAQTWLLSGNTLYLSTINFVFSLQSANHSLSRESAYLIL